MSLELQRRASEFLTRWHEKGLLPNLQDSWTARLVAYYASGEPIDWDARIVDMIKNKENSTNHATLPGDDDRQYSRELFELLNDIVKEEFADPTVLEFLDDRSFAPQETGERILKSIAMALEENGYHIDPVDPWDSFWGVRASDGKNDFAFELVFHGPPPQRWWHISLEDRRRRRIKDPCLLERLKQIIYSRVSSLPFIRRVTLLPDN